jgi:DNA-directed RNA polymerase subunit RPC12/RpoP
MADARQAERGGGLYERLLQRLALALEEADTASRLHAEPLCELELDGLSPAELELIRAYLNRDLHWLRGWHAAAEELALMQRQPLRAGKTAGRKPLGKLKPLMKRRQALCCALCGTPVNWQRGQEAQACQACGSKLFRSGNSR